MVTISSFALIPNTQIVGNSSMTLNYRVIMTSTGQTSNGKLYAVSGYNSGPDQFLMIFNQTNSPPTNGEVAVFSFPIQSLKGFCFDISYYGADLYNVVVCNSTTSITNTIGLTNCSFQGIIGK